MTSFGCVIKTELKYDVTHLSQNVLTILCLVLTQCKSIILTFLLLTNVLSVEAKKGSNSKLLLTQFVLKLFHFEKVNFETFADGENCK